MHLDLTIAMTLHGYREQWTHGFKNKIDADPCALQNISHFWGILDDGATQNSENLSRDVKIPNQSLDDLNIVRLCAI